MTGMARWLPLRVLSLQSGAGEAEGSFTHTLEAPPRVGASGWVALAIQVSEILGSWLSPVASEDPSMIVINRSPLEAT